MASMIVDLPDAGGADEGDEIDVGEVDVGRRRGTRRSPRISSRSGLTAVPPLVLGVEQLGEQGADRGRRRRPRAAQVLVEQLLRGPRAVVGRSPLGAGASRRARARTSTHARPEQLADLRRPARRASGPRTTTRSQASSSTVDRPPARRACRAACAAVGRTRAATARTSAGTPGSSSHDVDLLVCSPSPKSSCSGEPQ